MGEVTDLLRTASSVARFLLLWSWQTALLIGCVWLGLKAYRSQGAALRYQIWLSGLMAVAALPLWMSFVPSFPWTISTTLGDLVELPVVIVSIAQESTSTTRTAPQSDVPLIWVSLFALWAVGTAVVLIRHMASYRRLRRARSEARPVSIGALGCADMIDWGSLAPETVCVGLSAEVQSPVLIGWLQPMIVLPTNIASWATAEERALIIQHELTHLQRRDHYATLFQSLLSTIFFFHPLVRYGCRQLSLERELACDDRVISLGHQVEMYAESLLKVAERSLYNDMSQQPAFLKSKTTLERRINMILNKHRRPVSSSPCQTGFAWHWHLILPLGLIGILTWLLLPSPSAMSRGVDSIALLPPPPTITQQDAPPPPPPPVIVKRVSAPPPPPPPKLAPLPEEVTAVYADGWIAMRISQSMGVELVPIEIASQALYQDSERKQHHTGEVTVRTQNFAFTASQAVATTEWVFLSGPVVVHNRDRELHAEGVFVRRSPGGLIEFWVRHLTSPDGQPATSQDLMTQGGVLRRRK